MKCAGYHADGLAGGKEEDKGQVELAEAFAVAQINAR